MLHLPVRYLRLYSRQQPYGCSESDCGMVDDTLPLPLRETAFILVDCWNMHYLRSFEERADRICRERIAPALAAARAAGLTVIHAPSPMIAEKYRQAEVYRDPADQTFAAQFGAPDPDWPPAEFIARAGRHARFARDYAVPEQFWIEPYQKIDIHPAVRPAGDDFVVVNQPQLQRLLKDKRLLHLVYVGFATNMCLMGRDFAVRPMAWLGYNTIVLRDCTTAVEFDASLAELTATRMALAEMEHFYGYSALSTDFIRACGERDADPANPQA